MPGSGLGYFEFAACGTAGIVSLAPLDLFDLCSGESAA